MSDLVDLTQGHVGHVTSRIVNGVPVWETFVDGAIVATWDNTARAEKALDNWVQDHLSGSSC
jgi:hypothetical protein